MIKFPVFYQKMLFYKCKFLVKNMHLGAHKSFGKLSRKNHFRITIFRKLTIAIVGRPKSEIFLWLE